MGAVTLEVTDAVPVDITAQAYLSEPTASGCRAIGDHGSYTATDSVASHPAGGLETYVRAEALLSDGSTEDVTEMVTWALAAPAAGATIFQDGRLMTGPPSGSPANLHVVATLQGLSDSIDIVQVPDAITELVLNRGTDEDDPLNLLVGSTGQLQAHGSFGGTWYCVTPDAAFLSNDPAVCEAGNAPGSEGLVSATSPGMTTVDAELDGAVDDIEVLVSSP
jgi:hypothetical protein